MWVFIYTGKVEVGVEVTWIRGIRCSNFLDEWK